MKEQINKEVDVYDVVLTLWAAKKIIIIFVIISMLFGAGLIAFKPSAPYFSEIKVEIKKNPIIFNSKEALVSFEKIFYTQEVFDSWADDSNASINFEDFSRNGLVNRFVVSKTSNKIADFIYQRNYAIIRVKSDNLSIVSQFYNYSNYVSTLIKPDLLREANRKLNLMEKRYKDRDMNNKIIVERFSLIDRYISRLNDGFDILEIKPPTIPEKADKNKLLRTLVIYALIGFILGSFFVLLKNAFQARKNSKQIS